MATCVKSKYKNSCSKRPTSKILHRENYIYISSKSNIKEQINKCKKLFNEGYNEVFFHSLGRAINTGINLALTIVEDSNGTLHFEVNTSTVEIFDDVHPLSNDDDFEVRKRLNSCIHIRIFKNPINVD